MRFSPTAQGDLSSSFTIASDDPDEEGSVTIALNGKGAILLIDPGKGTIGTEITITGTGFGDKKGKVLIGGVAPRITGWNDTQILGTLSKVPTADVPSDVVIQTKTAGSITEAEAFTACSPKISEAPPSGASGSPTAITINGDYFSFKKGKVTLERGGVIKSCKVEYWGMDTIRFLVPKKLTPGEDYTLKVTNKVGFDTIPFEVTAGP